MGGLRTQAISAVSGYQDNPPLLPVGGGFRSSAAPGGDLSFQETAPALLGPSQFALHTNDCSFRLEPGEPQRASVF